MLLLALDTATDRGALALVDGETLLAEYSLESAGTYLSCLLPGVAAVLQAAGRAAAELQAVGVSLGPGNFTGLRLGIATAKALAWSLSCPLVPVPTMEVLAAQCAFQGQPVGVVLDAKRGEVFWGVYRGPADRPRLESEPVRLPLAELARRLTPPLLLTGPGLEVFADFFQAHLGPGLSLAPPDRRYPKAATLARLALARLQAGLTAAPEQLVPSYLRPAL